ncbi:hypothetical protein JJB09_21305 [Rhizobium sp. KVB221]|uniref:Uncharacterized protein n=1 Tax=Rhizobium setariae TaxID=2801340 RepID=A0A936YU38_9HYPH|nr:hypothetical protein [Rhizobium setariae]MBL0374554.1 hypothetical protein [Rhizobium setariae]
MNHDGALPGALYAFQSFTTCFLARHAGGETVIVLSRKPQLLQRNFPFRAGSMELWSRLRDGRPMGARRDVVVRLGVSRALSSSVELAA